MNVILRSSLHSSYSSLARRHGLQSPCRPSFRWLQNRTAQLPSASRQKSNPARSRDGKYGVFKSIIEGRFKHVLDQLGPWSETNVEYRKFGVLSEHGVASEVSLFRQTISKAFAMAEKGDISRETNPLFWSLRAAFVRQEVKGLTSEVLYSFRKFMMRSRLQSFVTPQQRQLVDFRFPFDWFPATRAVQRTIHLHVGPTNSGKTYHALKALESAKSGIYGGPLRLLAHEIYSRFQAKGKPCAMVTGEEQRIPDADSYFISCTVEMTPLNRLVDVAVIDEIQLIGDADRGWAWTQAFLGVMAKEVHLCGEDRVVDLIKSLCASIGDECVVHRYERLSPLETMDKSLGNDLTKLQKGDAVVAFSRLNLHALKKAVERATGSRCAIVYGSLPPETRAQQAALFNDPNNDYDILVASDAIGMGLNLEVRRVIFESATKHDGFQFRSLTTSEIKQIGGRAGRYKTARQEMTGSASETNVEPQAEEQKMGYVTCLDKEDLPAVRKAFSLNIEPLKQACIQPPAFVIERFAEHFPPDTPLSFILLRLCELAVVSPRFSLQMPADLLEVADLIQGFPMTITERLTLLQAPCSTREMGMKEIICALARCVSRREGGGLCDIKEIRLEDLDSTLAHHNNDGKVYLKHLEALHKALTLYLWMSYRMPSIFISQNLAFHVKHLVEKKIDDYLTTNVETLPGVLEKRREMQRRAAKRKVVSAVVSGGGDGVDVPVREGPGRWIEPGHQEPLVDDPAELDEAEGTII